MSKPAQHEPAAEAPPEPKASGGGLMRLVIIAGFVVSVVAGECLAAYFLVPSASELAAAAEVKLNEKAKEKEKKSEEAEEGMETEETPTTEVELGTFRISSHLPAANSTLRVDFKLAGTVAVADKEKFADLIERNQFRVRDRIIFEVRGAQVADLSDPGLGLLKRRILERVNTVLGKPVLKGVVVSDFSFVGA